MTSLRLLADDLTGALDSAAEFVALTGPVMAFWRGVIPTKLPKNAAIDSGTRELPTARAAAIVRDLTQNLWAGSLAFKKIDSLFRGATIVGLAAVMDRWQYCVLAPAFPFQGRITRAGRQYAKDARGDWHPVGCDLVAALRGHGVEAHQGRIDDALRPGITVFDAESDDALSHIVARVRQFPHPVLWSGTGGLAQALAAGATAPTLPPLPRPILGLFGSDHAITAAQLAACDPHWTVLPDAGSASSSAVGVRLGTTGLVLLSFDLPAETPRTAAADHIAQHIHQLVRSLDPPGTLIVAGGETLRSVCHSLGATALEVQGRIVPGLPCSVLCGGRWNGVTIVSKSGAFGHQHLLRDLLSITSERTAP